MPGTLQNDCALCSEPDFLLSENCKVVFKVRYFVNISNRCIKKLFKFIDIYIVFEPHPNPFTNISTYDKFYKFKMNALHVVGKTTVLLDNLSSSIYLEGLV